jgi:DNA modification methylase
MPHQPHLMDIDSEEHISDEENLVKKEYKQRLSEALKDPEFRKIEGFPIGEDESILAISDPPHYTACPNPFIIDFIKNNSSKVDIKKYVKPYAADVHEGKYHPFYKIHPYSTKSPHQAILRYILHYTNPGDIVFDGFCGTGMTGLAAQLSGDESEIRKLGYKIKDKNIITDELGSPISEFGPRKAILCDISPSATFIAHQSNRPINRKWFEITAKNLLKEIENECSWMFITLHEPSSSIIQTAIQEVDKNGPEKVYKSNKYKFGKINYVAWSDVFLCPECSTEIVFWHSAVNEEKGQVKTKFKCKNCNLTISKNQLERVWEPKFDNYLGKTIRQAKTVPVFINYSYGNSRFKKDVDEFDLRLIQNISENNIPYQFPTDLLPVGFNTKQPADSHGLTNIHHFYTQRNLYVLSSFVEKSKRNNDFLFALTRVASQITKRYRLTYQNGVWGAGGGPLPGTLYIPSLVKELDILKQLRRAIKDHAKTRAIPRPKSYRISTNSSTNLKGIEDNTIDYIFVDPPFGGNLMYSELNYLWEGWLRVFTDNRKEAIENTEQSKDAFDYQSILTECFEEFYRVLKPDRWITVEFHNSKKSIWNAIQEAMQIVGFVVADVRILDKKKKTFKQATSTGAVNQDLIITAYKPSESFQNTFSLIAGQKEGAWEFVRQHLSKLPIVVGTDRTIEALSERQQYLLFDRMVGYHVQKGLSIPLSASEFYRGLEVRFIKRDGMFFLPDQVPQYDIARIKTKEIGQLSIFVSNEKTSIQWLRQILDPELGGQPQEYSEILPMYLKQLHQYDYEELPELGEILEQNFLQYDDGQWYVPDPNKSNDLEKIRNKALLREFNQYIEGTKILKQFRTEAIRAGVADAWQNKDFATIVKVAERLPESVLQEDPDLLMYYDNANLRVD